LGFLLHQLHLGLVILTDFKFQVFLKEKLHLSWLQAQSAASFKKISHLFGFSELYLTVDVNRPNVSSFWEVVKNRFKIGPSLFAESFSVKDPRILRHHLKMFLFFERLQASLQDLFEFMLAFLQR
jgi:hypothetical protein